MKVILICGKLCSGKSVYAEKVRAEEKAVILSCDELMLALFDEQLGARHEEVSAAVQEYLFKKAIETAQAGMQGAYFVDEGLLEKMKALFETPKPEEIDVWYENEWRPE